MYYEIPKRDSWTPLEMGRNVTVALLRVKFLRFFLVLLPYDIPIFISLTCDAAI